MARLAAVICMAMALSACGGGGPERSDATLRPPALPVPGTQLQFASGPISAACLQRNRPGATPRRCGCVQAVANQTLSQSQQQRSVPFFNDPGRLQDVRQSDAPANERFWEAWRRFSETAEQFCADV